MRQLASSRGGLFLHFFQQSKIGRENLGLSAHPIQREGFSGPIKIELAALIGVNRSQEL
jgi:hypothetical protein